MYYVIDKIHVINPIKTTSIMVNEVRDKANASAMRRAMMANTTDDCHILLRGSARQQRTTLMLRDVRYIIEAHFELEDNPKGLNPDKVQSLIGKRSLAGACYNQPYFGLRENVAHFRQYEGKVVVPEEARITKDLGLMFHSYDYTDPQDPKPMFFQAKLVDGTITIPPVDSEEVFK
jgi:CRISPR-associated protein Cas5d